MSNSQDQLNKIENKIDRLDAHLSNIDATLAAQHQSLREHMRRTEVVESIVFPLKTNEDRRQGMHDFLTLGFSLLAATSAFLAVLHYLGKI